MVLRNVDFSGPGFLLGRGANGAKLHPQMFVEEEEKNARAAVQAAVIRLHDLLVRVHTPQ